MAMNSSLGQALCTVRTSNQWAVLDGIVVKVNKKMERDDRVDARGLMSFLGGLSKEELQLHGIWTQTFNGGSMIVCLNPAYRRAIEEIRDHEGELYCTCSSGVASGRGNRHSRGGDSSKAEAGAVNRYFGSHDYNAGRHAYKGSSHKPSCPLWAPAPSGHIHSWRRGYEDTKST